MDRYFIAEAYGYKYRWQIIGEPIPGPHGGYVWAKPIQRLAEQSPKRGRLRTAKVWPLSLLPRGPGRVGPSQDPLRTGDQAFRK
jgi:hypothetical protein